MIYSDIASTEIGENHLHEWVSGNTYKKKRMMNDGGLRASGGGDITHKNNITFHRKG